MNDFANTAPVQPLAIRHPRSASLLPVRTTPSGAHQGMNTASLVASPQRGRAPLLLFALAGAGLGFELLLTRLFSLRFQYHFVFLAISLAILGISLGAALAQLGIKRQSSERADKLLLGLLLAVALTLPQVALTLSHPFSGIAVGWLLFGAMLPFLLIGAAITLIFARDSSQSGILYAADLAGAAFGVLGTVFLLTRWSPVAVAQGLGGLVLCSALLYAGVRGRRGWGVGSLAAVILLVNLSAGLWGAEQWTASQSANAPRDKTLFALLSDPGQAARIVRTRWSPIARVDVVETADPSAKFVFTDGGAGSYMLRFDGDLATVAQLREQVEFLPFIGTDQPKTLILGAGAGKDILQALLAGSTAVTAVEINPAMIAATRADAAYNGAILDRPEVSLILGDARTFVERSREQYDLIYLNLVYTQAANPTGLALLESYSFTTQAFQAYFAHLTEAGMVAMVTHNALEGSRAMLTALQALDEVGIPPAAALDHLALWMVDHRDPTLRSAVLLLRKQPFPSTTVSALSAQADALQLQPLFVPGEAEAAFAPLRQGMRLATFVQEDAAYDLSPTSDNRPFFFKLDWGVPAAIRQMIWVAGLLLLLLLALALLQRADEQSRSGLWSWPAALLYTLLIGIGFMWVQAPLIQRLQLLLGNPTLALVVVLATLLLAGSVGSYLSQRWQDAALARLIWLAALWISAWCLLYWLILPAGLALLTPLSLPQRVGASIVIVALPALALGLPFPSLLRTFSASPRKVAMLWSVNGAASVLGSALAIATVMTLGFGATLLGAAAAYGGVAALSWQASAKAPK